MEESMRNLFSALLFSMASQVAAGAVPVFDCWIGGQTPALQVSSEANRYGYLAYHLRIMDPRICEALHVVCPFDSPAYRGDSDLGGRWLELLRANPKYYFVAVKSRNMDGVALFSDAAGMKVMALETGGNPGYRIRNNWYFHPGQCIGGY
jgi:hypothetical protein